jgi:DNA-directed RNA polymerase III subunit RPC8
MGKGGKKSPYMIYGTMEDAGLGPCLWWDGEEEVES